MRKGYKKIRLTYDHNSIAEYVVNDLDAVLSVSINIYQNGSEQMLLRYVDGVRLLNSPNCFGEVIETYNLNLQDLERFRRYTDARYEPVRKYELFSKSKNVKRTTKGRTRFLRYDYYRAVAVQEYSNINGIKYYICDDEMIKVFYDDGVHITYMVNEGENQLKETIKLINKRLGGNK